MKHLTKYILAFVVLVWFLFTNFIVTASYEKPTAPTWLSQSILNSANVILDSVYNKRTNTTKYPTEESYIAYLDKVINALNNLKNNFSSSDTRYILVTYLSSWLTNIKYSVLNDDNLLNSISNIINDWNNSTWTASWNCILNTNDLIWWEKYIDTDNFTLTNWNEIYAKFYLLNWVYKRLSIKCNNWIKSINTNETAMYSCNQWYNATNWICVVNNVVSTVYFDWNGWIWHSPVSKATTQNSAIWTLPSNPTREWYIFNWWFTASTWWTQITESTIYSSTSATTYYAQWGYTYSWNNPVWGWCTATLSWSVASCGKIRKIECIRNDSVVSADSFCSWTKPVANLACETKIIVNKDKFTSCNTICANDWKICYKWSTDLTASKCSRHNVPWDTPLHDWMKPWCDYVKNWVSCYGMKTVETWKATCSCCY